MAGGKQVGHCLADHRMRQTAYLWLVPGKPGEGFAGKVKAVNLALLRAAVRGRLADGGPWWAREHPDGLETE